MELHSYNSVFILILFSIIKFSVSNEESPEETASSVINFWKKNEKKFIEASQKDIILMLGNSGSGKSTLSLLLTKIEDLEVKRKNNSKFDATIDDKNRQIGGGADSQTIIPTLMIDNKTQSTIISYYDCPGFLDNRPLSTHIAVAYFLNKAITLGSSVKLVFAVDYGSFKQERASNLFSLVKQTVLLVNDIGKFKAGIAMIVTKIDNFNGGGDYTTDEEIYELIESQFKNIRDTRGNSTKESDIQIIKFIDALCADSNENNKSYPRIGLFRKPFIKGLEGNSWSIEKVPNYKTIEADLKKIIYKNIEYVPSADSVFGYSIDPDKIEDIENTLKELFHNQLMPNVSDVCDTINLHFYNQAERLADIGIMHVKLSKGYELYSKIDLEEFPPKMLTKLVDIANSLEIAFDAEKLKRIPIMMECFMFLMKVSKKELPNSPVLRNKVKNSIKQIENSLKWYGFLNDCPKKLSAKHPEPQKVKAAAASVRQNIPNNIKEPMTVDSIGLYDFLKQTNMNHSYDILKDLTLNPPELRALKFTLTEIFGHTLKISYLENEFKLTAKGYNIKMTDVINHQFWSSAKSIEIFALNTLIIDQSIIRPGTIFLIIAPRWEISDNVRIDLNGIDGVPHERNNARDGERNNENLKTRSGEDGIPGNPGQHAGSFIGIGAEFVCSSFLEVSAKGGSGASGQDGGYAVYGRNGITPCAISRSRVPNGWSQEGFMYYGHGTNVTYFPVYSKEEKYEVHPKEVTMPGNGGNGGAGGMAGQAGKIILIDLSDRALFKITQDDGNTGSNGAGREGGCESKAGDILFFLYGSVHFPGFVEYYVKEYQEPNVGAYYEKGKDGISGGNKNGQKKPDEVSKFKSTQISEYKKFVRMHLANHIQESALNNFVKGIEADKRINNLYDIFGLIEELSGLENQFFEYRHKLSFEPFFESLLKRIENFAKRLPSTNDQTKKVLIYLYSATLSKLLNVKKNKVKNYSVVDLDTFFVLNLKSIKELKKTESQIVINRYRDEYLESLKRRIDTANEVIEKQIRPEIDSAISNIDAEIDHLIKESVANQNAQGEAIRLNDQLLSKMHNKMALRTVLSGMKVIGASLSIFGPAAPLGAVVCGAVSLAENLAVDDGSIEGAIIQPSKITDGILSSIKDIIAAKANAYKNAIDNIDKCVNELMNSPGNITDAAFKISMKEYNELKNSVDKLMASNDKGNEIELQHLNDKKEALKAKSQELVDQLKKRKEELGQHEKEAKKLVEKRMEYHNTVKRFLTALDYGVDAYNKYSKDKKTIDTAAKATEGLEKQLALMRQHEENIHKIMIPKLRQMQNMIEKATQHLEGNQHAELDVGKWKMQVALRDLKVIFKRMTQGFDTQDNLLRSVQKLEEGLDVLFDVYNRIDSYSDQANLAGYIANLNSNTSLGINIIEPMLIRAVTNLQYTIKSNLVLEHFSLSMHAFKQRYFPLAHEFLAKYDLPDVMNTDGIENLILKSYHMLKGIKDNIDKTNSVLNAYDNHLYPNASFNSKNPDWGKQSFYVWNYDNIKDEMEQLLEGKEITLKADIANGLEHSAVKFYEIQINLTIPHLIAQKNLTKNLREFEVNLKMTGNQYYRCGNKTYFIPLDGDINIKYSLDSSGAYNDKNAIYHKILKEPAFLSPYTTWSIRLEGDIKKLADFKKMHIGLELIGRGSYIDGQYTNEYCSDRVDYYYNLDIGCYNGKNEFLSQNLDGTKKGFSMQRNYAENYLNLAREKDRDEQNKSTPSNKENAESQEPAPAKKKKFEHIPAKDKHVAKIKHEPVHAKEKRVEKNEIALVEEKRDKKHDSTLGKEKNNGKKRISLGK